MHLSFRLEVKKDQPFNRRCKSLKNKLNKAPTPVSLLCCSQMYLLRLSFRIKIIYNTRGNQGLRECCEQLQAMK